jgi:hypothetical protein
LTLHERIDGGRVVVVVVIVVVEVIVVDDVVTGVVVVVVETIGSTVNTPPSDQTVLPTESFT